MPHAYLCAWPSPCLHPPLLPLWRLLAGAAPCSGASRQALGAGSGGVMWRGGRGFGGSSGGGSSSLLWLQWLGNAKVAGFECLEERERGKMAMGTKQSGAGTAGLWALQQLK